jgi:SAM-dependent methyltransferase
MARKAGLFTHRDKFSGYMGVVLDCLDGAGRGRRVLDVPAGAGHLGRALRERGYQVVDADANRDSPGYVFVDMNLPLPFEDGSFDVVTCLEGIEHILDPYHLLGELARVARPGGTVVISTPNVLCLYSRLQFLLTGTFLQFNPFLWRRAAPGAVVDRGHISPVALPNLRYLAEYHGLELVAVRTDRWKKKVLAPLGWLLWPLGREWGRCLRRAGAGVPGADGGDLGRHLFSGTIWFGRTLVAVFRKRDQAAAGPRAG